MDPKLITSFFTNNGVPALGLTPTINIWLVTPSSQTIIVNSASMDEVGDGFYKYDFAAYDPDSDYVIRTDGGSALPNGDRYQSGANEHYGDDAAHYTWEAQKNDHISTGSMGEAINNISADVTQLRLDVTSMHTLVNILVKYEHNRTRIDKVAKTLTVYDDDGTTPLQVFDLFDSSGAPSTAEVCERVPQ